MHMFHCTIDFYPCVFSNTLYIVVLFFLSFLFIGLLLVPYLLGSHSLYWTLSRCQSCMYHCMRGTKWWWWWWCELDGEAPCTLYYICRVFHACLIVCTDRIELSIFFKRIHSANVTALLLWGWRWFIDACMAFAQPTTLLCWLESTHRVQTPFVERRSIISLQNMS